MADEQQTTTTPDGKTVPAGDTANTAVNGPEGPQGAKALKAKNDKNGDGAQDLDETTPGGRYVLASGQVVDADGAEVK